MNDRRLCVGLRSAPLVVALLGSACAHYEPTVPMRARSGDVTAELEKARIWVKPDLDFRTHSTVAHTLGQAWLTVPSRSPCTGGADVPRLAIDGDVNARVLSAGTHTLRGSFDLAEGLLDLDLVLDVELEGGGCLRMPALSPSAPLRPQKRVTLVGGMDILAGNIAGLSTGMLSFRLGLGIWLGRAFVAASGGFGQVQCDKAVCGSEEKDKPKLASSLPVGIEVGAVAGKPLPGIAIPVGVRYSLYRTTLPTFDGPRGLLVHEAHASLGFAATLGGRGEALVHSEQGFAVEMAFVAGAAYVPAAERSRVSPILGIEARWRFQL